MELSFRDPGGRLLRIDDRILRFVTLEGAVDLNKFLSTATARRLVDDGRIVDSARIDTPFIFQDRTPEEIGNLQTEFSGVIEHPRIPFPAFSYEWSPNMLHAAAELTLDLAEQIAADGFGLKDATPDNVLFKNADPVFVDLLSFESRSENDPTWLPYAQFIRTFLLPLMAYKYFRAKLSRIFLTKREGLEPEDLYRVCGPLRRLTPPFLTMVSIPKWLGSGNSGSGIYRQQRRSNPEQARYILLNLFKSLRRQLTKVKPDDTGTSEWTSYAEAGQNGSDPYVSTKTRFISKFMDAYGPARVLDIGCNTGEFSKIAARRGAEVIAIDSDQEVISRVWRHAKDESLPILPLVVDIARPSPGTGWLNRENASFIDRATGYFDSVFMLAVIHHLLVTERIPLSEILGLAADLTTDHLIIEFVATDDPMFQTILRGRDELHRDFTKEAFETAFQKHFKVARIQPTPRPTRWLYHLRKKTPNTAR